jgi:hypothetical protein
VPLTGLIRDYDFYPPDDVRVFPMPGTAVRRLDHDAVVADVRYGDVIVHTPSAGPCGPRNRAQASKHRPW